MDKKCSYLAEFISRQCSKNSQTVPCVTPSHELYQKFLIIYSAVYGSDDFIVVCNWPL